MNVTEAHALAVTLNERIRLLIRIRQAYRRSLYRAEWSLPRLECETELRALLRLRRHAKRIARAAQQPRNVDYHTWQSTGPVTEDELFAGYGTDPVHIEDGRREGDPAFNGAFR